MGLQTALAFGKYRGLSVGAIAKFDPRYLAWMRDNVAGASFDPRAAEVIRGALRIEREQSMNRQNGWAWGFGRAARSAADAWRLRAIEIEHQERRNAGQTICPRCFPHNYDHCSTCKGVGWVAARRDSDRSGEAIETATQIAGSTVGESAVAEGQSPNLPPQDHPQ